MGRKSLWVGVPVVANGWDRFERVLKEHGLATVLVLLGLGFFAGMIPSPLTHMEAQLYQHTRDQKALMALVHQICRNGSWRPTPQGPQFDEVLRQRCDAILFRIVPKDADGIVNGR